MTLVRWEPVREVGTLQSEMNRLFGGFFDVRTTPARSAAASRRWVPAIDIVETTEEYLVRADLPGLSSEDVKIELDENVLTLSGERRFEHEQERNGYHRIERGHGSFSRSLALPRGVDGERIAATFKDGVLEIHVPRPEQHKPRRVTIERAPEATASVEAGESEPQAGEAPAAA